MNDAKLRVGLLATAVLWAGTGCSGPPSTGVVNSAHGAIGELAASAPSAESAQRPPAAQAQNTDASKPVESVGTVLAAAQAVAARPSDQSSRAAQPAPAAAQPNAAPTGAGPESTAWPETELSSRLRALFENAPATDLDAVDKAAAGVTEEVFSEEGLEEAKLFELQTDIRGLAREGKYSADEKAKVRILEAGLAEHFRETARDGERVTAEWLAGSAIAYAVYRGFDGPLPSLNFMRRAATSTVDAVKSGASAVRGAVESVGSRSTYRDAGVRVQGYLGSAIRRLSPPERLARGLRDLEVEPDVAESIFTDIVPKADINRAALSPGFIFRRTNSKRLTVAPVRLDGFSDDQYGYFIFRVKPARGELREDYLFQTRNYSQAHFDHIRSKMVYGYDKRVFAEIVPESGPPGTFQALNDRVSTSISEMRDKAGERAQAAYATARSRFSGSRALEALKPAVPVGIGYGIGVMSGEAAGRRDVFLESMLDQTEPSPGTSMLPAVGKP